MFNLLVEVGIGFMAGLSGITFPGPVFIFILQQSIARGFKSGFIATIAHALVGMILLVLLLLTGAVAFFKSSAFELYMGLVGGISLIILGVIILTDHSRRILSLKLNTDNPGIDPFIGGILVSISNPAFFLWWAVIGLPLLGQASDFAGILGIYAWTLGILAAVFIWYGGISFISAKGKEHIPHKLLLSISVACGLFLIFMGILFIAKYYVKLI
jgi:threonine/homoserine/homoserine lactone efflux protein